MVTAMLLTNNNSLYLERLNDSPTAFNYYIIENLLANCSKCSQKPVSDD